MLPGQALTHCAVARAVSRSFPDSRVIVGIHWVHINGKKGRLSQTVADNINKIMLKEEVKPFSFTMPELEI